MSEPPTAAPPRASRAAALRVAAWIAVLAWSPARAWAGDPPRAALADCDAPAVSQVLARAAVEATPRHAAWLDGRRLLWPGTPDDRDFLLHHTGAPLPGLLGEIGGDVVFGVGLHVATGERAIVPREFASLGPGVVLEIPETYDSATVRAWHRRPLEVQAWDRGARHDRPQATTGIQSGAALDDLFGDAARSAPLGARPAADATVFRVWAPTATAVSVCLYPGEVAAAQRLQALERDPATGVWSTDLPGDRTGIHYTYLVDVFAPGTGLVRNRVTDPYSLALGADSTRSVVVDLDAPALRPDGWDDDRAPVLAAPTDLVVYELHVRDFSANDASVPAAHRGRYLAFTDRDSNGMTHLRALAAAGVTDVHLLPVFDFATVPERGCVTPHIDAPARGDSEAPQAAIAAVAAADCFNWGYDPLHYTVPEGSYATDAGDYAARIREFRAMVAALHRAGLRVGMDVVYNHTSAAGQDPKSVLDRIVPGYYHRLDAKGDVEHSTCCANTATERLMMARLMLDSTATWVQQYHVDSFRFDLMGHQPRAVMEALRDRVAAVAGKPVPLLGEGWNFGEVADGARFVQASQLSLNGSGIGTFSDRARDAVRGGGPADRGEALLLANGFVSETAGTDAATRHRNADWLRAGLAGSVRDFTLADGRTLASIDYHGQPAGYVAEPAEVVNYVENHDNHTLFDLLALKLPADTPSRERARAQVLALATTAFSQGIAYFHAGVDVLRSKSLDRNSFDSGDWFNRLDWTYAGNGFGAGLPRAADNGDDWPLLAPRLRDARIAPQPADIAFARDAFRDLLRIRASSTLLRLRTAADIRQRLTFPDTGDDGLVVAGLLDGTGYAGAGFAQVLYVLNADAKAREVRVPAAAGQAWTLHPVLARPDAADARVREQARIDAAHGVFVVPARSAAVFVVAP